jgi:hypothetical protein
MFGIIRRYDWQQFPMTIALEGRADIRIEKVELKRRNDLQGILAEIEESMGSNLDER